MGEKTPKGSAIKFSMPGDVNDIVMDANFSEYRLRSFSVAEIEPGPIPLICFVAVKTCASVIYQLQHIYSTIKVQHVKNRR